jgi:DNA-binding NtrC family response regulator
MTAYASAESAIEMMALGVDAYLEKPFEDLDEVGQRVADILAKRHDSQSLAQARDHFRRVQEALSARASDDPLHVLVVCPSQADREFLDEHLPEDLEHLLNSVELMERLATDSGDMAVIDAVVAGGSLAEFVREIRKLAPELGLVVISDGVSLKVVTDLIDAGVDALVERPLDGAAFRRNTEHLLERLRG